MPDRFRRQASHQHDGEYISVLRDPLDQLIQSGFESSDFFHVFVLGHVSASAFSNPAKRYSSARTGGDTQQPMSNGNYVKWPLFSMRQKRRALSHPKTRETRKRCFVRLPNWPCKLKTSVCAHVAS